jgi:hypothetical protein
MECDRHDHQPTQVLPLDTANSLAHLRLRRRRASHARNCRIPNRREFIGKGLHTQGANSRLQGKWEMRGKRRGDLISEF